MQRLSEKKVNSKHFHKKWKKKTLTYKDIPKKKNKTQINKILQESSQIVALIVNEVL